MKKAFKLVSLVMPDSLVERQLTCPVSGSVGVVRFRASLCPHLPHNSEVPKIN